MIDLTPINAMLIPTVIDWTQVITTLIPTAVGGVGAFWGIFTYREAQKLKRKEILFPLIEELDIFILPVNHITKNKSYRKKEWMLGLIILAWPGSNIIVPDTLGENI
jgi:hypothetical protein